MIFPRECSGFGDADEKCVAVFPESNTKEEERFGVTERRERVAKERQVLVRKRKEATVSSKRDGEGDAQQT